MNSCLEHRLNMPTGQPRVAIDRGALTPEPVALLIFRHRWDAVGGQRAHGEVDEVSYTLLPTAGTMLCCACIFAAGCMRQHCTRLIWHVLSAYVSSIQRGTPPVQLRADLLGCTTPRWATHRAGCGCHWHTRHRGSQLTVLPRSGHIRQVAAGSPPRMRICCPPCCRARFIEFVQEQAEVLLICAQWGLSRSLRFHRLFASWYQAIWF